jgi:hypothetical protein
MGDGTCCHYCGKTQSFCDCPPSRFEIELDDKDRIIWAMTRTVAGDYRCALTIMGDDPKAPREFCLIQSGRAKMFCKHLGDTEMGPKLNDDARYWIDMAHHGKSVVPPPPGSRAALLTDPEDDPAAEPGEVGL